MNKNLTKKKIRNYNKPYYKHKKTQLNVKQTNKQFRPIV